MFYKNNMTIKSHLFNSFVLHILLLAYLLSLPVYRGNISLRALGSYFVYLKSEEGMTEVKPSVSHKYLKSEESREAVKEKKIPLETRITGMKETVRNVDDEKATASEMGTDDMIAENIQDKEAMTIEVEKTVKLSVVEQPPKEAPPQKVIEEIKKEPPQKDILKIKEPPVTKPLPAEEKKEPASPPKEAKPAKEFADKAASPLKEEPSAAGQIPPSILPETDKSISLQAKVEKKAPPEIEPKEQSEVAKHPLETKAVNEKDDVTANHGEAAKPDREAVAAPPSEKKEAPVLKKGIHKAGKVPRGKMAAPEKKGLKPGQYGETNLKGKAITPAPLSKDDKLSGQPLADNKVPSGTGSHTETSHGNDKTGPEAAQTAAGKKPEGMKEVVKDKKPPSGIPVPEILLLRDIKIEVFLKGTDMSNISSHLYRKAHPMAERTGDSKKQKETGSSEETYIEAKSGVRRLVHVAKAEEGIYTFVIRNKGDIPYKTDVMFQIFEGKKGERIRNFGTVELSPHAELRFKFVFPEAVFWDDDDYFTGTIESSENLSKFNDKTGLIWKEEKDEGGR